MKSKPKSDAQLSLFEESPAPQAPKPAAPPAFVLGVNTIARRIYECALAEDARGVIVDEVAVSLGLLIQTVSATFKKLKDEGYLRYAGRERRTRSKCFAGVFVAIPEALRVAPAPKAPRPKLSRPSPQAGPPDGDITGNFHGGNRYSREAFDHTPPKIRGKQRRKVYAGILAATPGGGTIADALEVPLGIEHQALTARVSELKAQGLVVTTGEKRPTRSGRAADVLIAKGAV